MTDVTARLWTIIENIADRERLSVEELARLTNHQLTRLPGFGASALSVLRERYPLPQPLPTPRTPRVIQIVGANDTVLLLRDDGAVFEWDKAAGRWRTVELP